MSDRKVLTLAAENGKQVTVEANGTRVAFILWRKSGAPLLPLVLSRTEAAVLRDMLETAIGEASK